MTAIVERTADAFVQAYSGALLSGDDRPLHRASAELLAHFAGELMALDQVNPGITAHQAVHLLMCAWRQEVGA